MNDSPQNVTATSAAASALPRRQRPQYSSDQLLIFSEKWLEQKQLKELELELGIQSKRGKFSLSESTLIDKEIKKYLEERDISMEDFQQTLKIRKYQSGNVLGSRELYTLIARRLANGRPAKAIYWYVRRKFHPNNYSNWTEKEDHQLKLLVQASGPSWEHIGLTMSRSPLHCRDRYRLIIGDRGPWSRHEEEVLQEVVQEVRVIKKSQPNVAFWNLVAEKLNERMKTLADAHEKVSTELIPCRTPQNCIVKWQNKVARMEKGSNSYDDDNNDICNPRKNKDDNDTRFLFDKGEHDPRDSRNLGRLWTRQDDLALIRKLWRDGYLEESDIVWRKVMDYSVLKPNQLSSLEVRQQENTMQDQEDLRRLSYWFPGKLQHRFTLLKRRVPVHEAKDLENMLQYLLNTL